MKKNLTSALLKSRIREQEITEKLTEMLAASIDTLYDRKNYKIFLFGPAPSSTNLKRDMVQEIVWMKREELRIALESNKFFAIRGEDLQDIGRDEIEKSFNPLLKEQLLADKVHQIIILDASYGSTSELSIFSQYPTICSKMIVAINEEKSEDFVAKGPVLETESCGAVVVKYVESDLLSCNLKSTIHQLVLKRFQAFLSNLITKRMCIAIR
jgi:hypothetical protein